MDAELEFAIQPSTTGKQLFDQVSLSAKCFGHKETDICVSEKPGISVYQGYDTYSSLFCPLLSWWK